MKLLLPLSTLLLVAGCFSQPQSTRIYAPGDAVKAPADTYAVLKGAPDAILDDMSSKYSGNTQQWCHAWKQDNSTTPIDGQRTIRLLELACYADVMCHAVEYPLRVATLDYVRENLDIPEVQVSLSWIRSSYNSGLPIDSPGDDTGDFKGVLVESMKIRMSEYANELLKSPEYTKDRQ